MARSYDLFLVDAFTRKPFTGNPAGVVLGATGLGDVEMQAVAREISASETAFLFPATAVNHDLRVRFFTPRVEVPICGHATIALHHVLAELHVEKATNEGARYFQHCSAGIYPVELFLKDESPWVVMSQPIPDLCELPPDLPRERMLAALGLQEEDLDNALPLGAMVSGGEYTVFVPVRRRAVLDSLTPRYQRLSTGYTCYMLYTTDSPDPAYLTYCRMFAPAYGIDEDPVTGMANGPLGAFLTSHGLARDKGGRFRFLSRQGVAMGRPGEVEVTIGHEGTLVRSVEVAGAAVTILRSTLTLP